MLLFDASNSSMDAFTIKWVVFRLERIKYSSTSFSFKEFMQGKSRTFPIVMIEQQNSLIGAIDIQVTYVETVLPYKLNVNLLWTFTFRLRVCYLSHIAKLSKHSIICIQPKRYEFKINHFQCPLVYMYGDMYPSISLHKF